MTLLLPPRGEAPNRGRLDVVRTGVPAAAIRCRTAKDLRFLGARRRLAAGNAPVEDDAGTRGGGLGPCDGRRRRFLVPDDVAFEDVTAFLVERASALPGKSFLRTMVTLTCDASNLSMSNLATASHCKLCLIFQPSVSPENPTSPFALRLGWFRRLKTQNLPGRFKFGLNRPKNEGAGEDFSGQRTLPPSNLPRWPPAWSACRGCATAAPSMFRQVKPGKEAGRTDDDDDEEEEEETSTWWARPAQGPTGETENGAEALSSPSLRPRSCGKREKRPSLKL